MYAESGNVIREMVIHLEDRDIALLSQEGSGIAKRIPRGVVPNAQSYRLRFWNHPGALRHPKSLDGCALSGLRSQPLTTQLRIVLTPVFPSPDAYSQRLRPDISIPHKSRTRPTV